MALPLHSFRSLPTPMKIALGVLGGAGLVGLVYLPFRSGRVMWVFLVGLIVVALLLAAYRFVLKALRKRKASPFEQGLVDHSGATPQAVTEPARRARLDELRRNFEGGVQKFRAAGKDLYSLPWYLLVGEPGGGKTEAVRHCNVGFPPGLQDELQGAGGTINMNWWFTNHAVILDTAGRLMFEEVEAGATGEWQEFLRLLRISRGNCPVNGMLLVIPADSLITDTADDLERKGARIARQLDQIQRALEVRFPVFVVVTKCDLINGFREFFENIDDPQLQHQMVGWSNPLPLDDPFDPELVQDHIETVLRRIRRRRLALLLDPVGANEPGKRRADLVDALYAFPQSLARIVPRLRRYLEMIFVAGEWSAKPLFLRGIYFTSSMREGSALDADLAEALGVPVESLPEGKVWERDRAYFLRDLFMKKVFVERGLVTRAGNTKAQQRRRRAVLLGAGLGGLVVLYLLTWLGARSLSHSIGRHRDYWLAAAAEENWRTEGGADYWRPIVSPEFRGSTTYVYGGATPVEVGGRPVTAVRFLQDLVSLSKEPIRVPWVFRWLGGHFREREPTQHVLFECAVLRPAVDAARQVMLTSTGDWSPQATSVLAGLLGVEASALNLPAPPGGDELDLDLDAMLTYVLAGDEDRQQYLDEDSDAVAQVMADWRAAGAGSRWAEGLFNAGTDAAEQAIESGAKAFVAYMTQRAEAPTGDLARVCALYEHLAAASAAEQELLKAFDALDVQAGEPDTREGLQQATDAWTRHWRALAGIPMTDEAFAVLQDRPLAQAYTEAVQQSLDAADREYGRLLAQTGRTSTPAGGTRGEFLARTDRELRAHWDELRQEITATVAPEEVSRLDTELLARLDSGDRLLTVRYKMYSLAAHALDTRVDVTRVTDAPNLLQAVGDEIARARSEVQSLLALGPDEPLLARAAGTADVALTLAARARTYAVVAAVLEAAPDSGEKIGDAVQASVEAAVQRPDIPFTNLQGGYFAARYDPDAAASVLGACRAVGDAIRSEDTELVSRDELARAFAEASAVYAAYADLYRQYWTARVPDELASRGQDWLSFHGALGRDVKPYEVNDELEKLGRAMADAFSKVVPVAPPSLAEEFAAAAATVEESLRDVQESARFERRCSDLIEQLRNLGSGARVARRTMLSQTAQGFCDKYAPFPRGSGPNFASRYWADLAYEALRLIADEAEREARSGAEELLRYGKFPLARPGEDAADLTPQQLATARQAMEKITGVPDYVPGGPAGETIGTGAMTGEPRTDDQLRRLRGHLGDDQERIARIARVLAALPPEGESLACKLAVLSEEEQRSLSGERRTVFDWCAHVGLAQGETELGRDLARQPEAKPLAEPRLPGDDVTLNFYFHPSDTEPGATVSFAGPWGCLRLLHEADSVSRLEDGKAWRAAVVVKDDADQERLLWVSLRFEKSLPEIDAWP
jgi:hypothetical protein